MSNTICVICKKELDDKNNISVFIPHCNRFHVVGNKNFYRNQLKNKNKEKELYYFDEKDYLVKVNKLKGGRKNKMNEKKKVDGKKIPFTIKWHKGGVECQTCHAKKNISEDRYKKLQDKRMTSKYICKKCRPSTKKTE